MNNIELNGLRREFAGNKQIPKPYERVILYALAGYPELRRTRIHFVLKRRGPAPSSTRPSLSSLFLPAAKRTYYIYIVENARGPKEKALLKNLPEDAQVGMLAHELFHVVQFNARSAPELAQIMLRYPMPSNRRWIERSADLGAIQHGFGEELLAQAEFVRKIPGYTEERKELNKYYLKPGEIIKYLKKYRKHTRRRLAPE